MNPDYEPRQRKPEFDWRQPSTWWAWWRSQFPDKVTAVVVLLFVALGPPAILIGNLLGWLSPDTPESSGGGGNDGVIGGAALVVGVILLYFLPWIIARKKPHSGSVFVINLFLGWTLIGWVVALAMAVRDPNPPVIIQQAAPKPPPQSAEAPKPSIKRRLAELDGLRSDGLVTDDEYEVKRRQILEDL